MGKKDTPQAPDLAKSYQQGIDVYLKNNPTLLAAEEAARKQYDPTRIEDTLTNQAIYGPAQYELQKQGLDQLDPEIAALRPNLFNVIQSDLNGTAPKGVLDAATNDIRARQAASGNVNGSAPISAEAAVGANALADWHQRSIDNAGMFLGSPSNTQRALALAPVTPDRSSAYVNPNAGYQGANYSLNNYQNLLAQTQASGGASPWSRALGAVAGAAGGYATTGSPWGAVAGGVAGGAGGGWG